MKYWDIFSEIIMIVKFSLLPSANHITVAQPDEYISGCYVTHDKYCP